MKNERGELNIRNREEISFTGERKLLVAALLDSFRTLDPSRILRAQAERAIRSAGGFRNLYVIGFGKAALSMYSGIREVVGKSARYSGIIIPEGEPYDSSFPELDVLRGTHPLPTEESVRSTQIILKNLREHGPDDLIMLLISGGGSALFELPEPEFSIQDVCDITKCLLKSGANIRELNIIRHAISQVKGGKLADILKPSRVEALVVSDVPNDDLQLISSGPLTVPGYSSFDREEVVRRYLGRCPLLETVSENWRDIVHKGNPSNVKQTIVLRNEDFVQRIASFLSSEGQNVHSILGPITGDVEDVSRVLISAARQKYLEQGPIWIVAGGETTVNVRGNGSGGRNCELALRVSLNMGNQEDFLFSSVGTDGIDGVSPAMGGMTDAWFLRNASKAEITASLDKSDSYTLLNSKHSAILTGYTGTNVSDIFILYYNEFKLGESRYAVP